MVMFLKIDPAIRSTGMGDMKLTLFLNILWYCCGNEKSVDTKSILVILIYCRALQTQTAVEKKTHLKLAS